MKTIFTLSFILLLSIMSMATPVDEIYKREYPSCQYISEAQNSISDFGMKNEVAEQGRRDNESEDNVWDKANRSNTISNYEKYLDKYSNGRHVKYVKSRIEQLKSAAKPSIDPIITRLEQNMVHVKGGVFKMGCTLEQMEDCDEDEKPVHEVTLSSFYISKYEVTQAEWRAVMGSDPGKLKFKGCNRCPVEIVSWNEVQDFISKLNEMIGKEYRLPTEAEWEYAACGGKKSKGFKHSGSDNLKFVGWHKENSNSKTHEVGGKRSNELGLYDMNGNVWEWCSDWYGKDYYKSSPASNPKGPSDGTDTVIRGGSWNSYTANCLVSTRFSYPPIYGNFSFIGLRLVRDF